MKESAIQNFGNQKAVIMVICDTVGVKARVCSRDKEATIWDVYLI